MSNQHISEKRKSVHRFGVNIFSNFYFVIFLYPIALEVYLSSISDNTPNDCSVPVIISFDYSNLYSSSIISLPLKFVPHFRIHFPHFNMILLLILMFKIPSVTFLSIISLCYYLILNVTTVGLNISKAAAPRILSSVSEYYFSYSECCEEI